jgi:hypothetical protein
MENKTFEDFLMEYHAENNYDVLDDDFPDAYAAWVSELEPDEIMELAEKAILYYRAKQINKK